MNWCSSEQLTFYSTKFEEGEQHLTVATQQVVAGLLPLDSNFKECSFWSKTGQIGQISLSTINTAGENNFRT